jgi:hypothetical protein
MRYLRIVPRKGKRFDFSPAVADGFHNAGDEIVAVVEKAIRERALRHGIVLK